MNYNVLMGDVKPYSLTHSSPVRLLTVGREAKNASRNTDQRKPSECYRTVCVYWNVRRSAGAGRLLSAAHTTDAVVHRSVRQIFPQLRQREAIPKCVQVHRNAILV